jgi:DNA-binding response OmpR family regulator
MQQLSKIRLLLVEDDVETRNSLQLLLSRAGYDVLVATNGQQALTYIVYERIDMVLLGNGLVSHQGFALCAKLRRLSTLTIVFLAELAHPDDLITAYQSGANDYIITPLPANVLLARLRAVLRRAMINTPRHRRLKTGLAAKYLGSPWQ